MDVPVKLRISLKLQRRLDSSSKQQSSPNSTNLQENQKKNMAGKTVCLTGAEGFIGSWILKTLLEHGYTVRGTVRNLGGTYDMSCTIILNSTRSSSSMR